MVRPVQSLYTHAAALVLLGGFLLMGFILVYMPIVVLGPLLATSLVCGVTYANRGWLSRSFSNLRAAVSERLSPRRDWVDGVVLAGDQSWFGWLKSFVGKPTRVNSFLTDSLSADEAPDLRDLNIYDPRAVVRNPTLRDIDPVKFKFLTEHPDGSPATSLFANAPPLRWPYDCDDNVDSVIPAKTPSVAERGSRSPINPAGFRG